MNTAASFLLLLIFAALIFGVPIILLAIGLIDTISERLESARRAEGESTAEEKTTIEEIAPAEKKPINDAGEWTPARRLR
jgi:F0F1-type ATP synthase membrane subunit b/b'